MRLIYRNQNLSEATANILISSLTESTLRQYNSGLKNWWNFCKSANLDPFDFNTGVVLKFFTARFESGASYGTLNNERAAFSFVSKGTFTNDPLISRFFKGVFKLRPTKPKYNTIWDVEVALKWAESLDPLSSLNLKQLTYKLALLLALATAHRVQTLSLIKLNNIQLIDA